MKKELISKIREREEKLNQLKNHIEKSSVCADIYDKILIEKAILKRELDELTNNTFINKMKKMFSHKEKLICDYFVK